MTGDNGARPAGPRWLLAELTYRCPLHCVFCYNPVDYMAHGAELSTDDWVRVLREGRALGAIQLGFSGGEPLLRDDLEILVAEARGYDYPMVLNVVLHRLNIDHVGQILEMAEKLGAEYVELANTQYYGWGYVNRDRLLPTREQLERANEVTQRFRDRVGERMRVFFVVPDYFESRPKACMNGWGSVFLTVAPDGTALPCHAARMLPGLTFPNVRDSALEAIWYDSEGFNRYRGDAWMKDPCRSCPEKTKDFGGCRCQAYMLTGDPANADPVCDLSPEHHRVTDAVAQARIAAVKAQPIVFRDNRNSRTLARGLLPTG